jgi:hypothetical protein
MQLIRRTGACRPSAPCSPAARDVVSSAAARPPRPAADARAGRAVAARAAAPDADAAAGAGEEASSSSGGGMRPLPVVEGVELKKVPISELGKPNPKAFKTLNRSLNKVGMGHAHHTPCMSPPHACPMRVSPCSRRMGLAAPHACALWAMPCSRHMGGGPPKGLPDAQLLPPQYQRGPPRPMHVHCGCRHIITAWGGGPNKGLPDAQPLWAWAWAWAWAWVRESTNWSQTDLEAPLPQDAPPRHEIPVVASTRALLLTAVW